MAVVWQGRGSLSRGLRVEKLVHSVILADCSNDLQAQSASQAPQEWWQAGVPRAPVTAVPGGWGEPPPGLPWAAGCAGHLRCGCSGPAGFREALCLVVGASALFLPRLISFPKNRREVVPYSRNQ